MFVVLLSFTNMLLSGNTSSSLLQFSLYNHYPQPLCVWLVDKTSFHPLQRDPLLT